MDRFGSDKPDLRFGMELVDLAPGARRRGGAASGFRVFDETLAGGGRVKAIVAPGHGRRDPSRDRRADRAGQAVRREGPRPPRASRPTATVKGPIAKFLADDRQGGSSSGAGAGAGDLVLIVADARRRHRRRPRPAARRARRPARPGRPDGPGLLLGPPLPDVPVGRRERALGRDPQPVQRRRARGRGAARDRVRRPGEALAGRPGRPGPGAAVRPRAQRLGAGRRLGPDPPARPARAQLRAPGPHPRADARASSGRCSRRSSTARRRTAGSPSASTAGRRSVATRPNIREVMAFPKTQSGSDLMLEAPSPAGRRAVRRARAALRRRARTPSRPGPRSTTDETRTPASAGDRDRRSASPRRSACIGRYATPRRYRAT